MCILHVYTGTLVIHTSAVCILHVYNTGTLVIHTSAVFILHVYTGTLVIHTSPVCILHVYNTGRHMLKIAIGQTKSLVSVHLSI